MHIVRAIFIACGHLHSARVKIAIGSDLSLPKNTVKRKESLSHDSQLFVIRSISGQASLSERKFCRRTISRTANDQQGISSEDNVTLTTRKDACRCRTFLYTFYQGQHIAEQPKEIRTVTDVQ